MERAKSVALTEHNSQEVLWLNVLKECRPIYILDARIALLGDHPIENFFLIWDIACVESQMKEKC